MKFRSRSLVPPPEALKGLPIPPTPALGGLRITLSAQPSHLTAITTHGLEVEIPLTVEGLTQLRRMLEAQQQPKPVPLGLTPAYIWAEWTRVGPCGEGKVRKFDASGKPSPSIPLIDEAGLRL